MHDPFVAKLYCDKAFGIFYKTGNNEGLAEAYKIYGIIDSNMREWDSAESLLKKGIEILGEHENHSTKAEIYCELGAVKHKQNEEQAMLQYLQKALGIYEALGVDKEVSRITDEIRAIGDY